MRVNRALGAAAALMLALGLGVTGCSSNAGTQSAQSEDSSAQQSSEGPVVKDSTGTDMPQVSGGFGEDPTVTPSKADAPADITRQILVEGEKDATVVEADDAVSVNYAGYLWDGSLFDSSFGRGEPATFSLNSVISGWKYGLTGTKVGDRVLLVIPSEYGYGASGQGEIPGDATLVFVVDIVDVYGSNTQALEEATPTDNALPDGMLVDGALGTPPRVVFEEGVPSPTVEETIILAEGNGPVVTASDTVVYHYVGTYWGTTESAASTWDIGAQVLEAGDSLFLGEKVGSRIAMVFPPTASDQPAMVMIVDIMAAYSK